MKYKVLLIDDDRDLAELLSEYFSRYDIEVLAATNGMEGLKLLRNTATDCVLLDVMLPGEDGFAICREIRKFSHVPIIMLTARGELADRIVGLEMGADDYLPKPFEPRELAARVQAIFRRAKLFAEGKVLHYGDLEFDTQRRIATRNGQKLQLTTLEFDALTIFVQNVGKVLSRETLAELLSEANWESNSRSVDVVVSRIRQKLGDDSQNPHYLKTLRKSGYLLIEPETNGTPP